jgi:excisionase family DNA binding protein
MAASPANKPGTVPHAARRLGISIPTVYKLIGQGYLRAYKVGRATRISEEAIADCVRTLERECPVRLHQRTAA